MPSHLLRYLVLAVALLAGAGAILLGARLIAGGPAGRAIIVSQVDGASFGSAGRASLEGLDGDVLSGFSFDRFSLTADDGEWLVLEQVAIEWRPLGYLTSGRLTILGLDAARVAILDTPPAGETSSGGGSMPSLIVRRLEIAALELAEGLAGPQVTLRVHSELASQADGSLTLSANLQRTDEPGDTARLDVVLAADQTLQADLDAQGVAGGPLAALLRAPDSQIDLTAAISGGRESGAGQGALRLDGATVADYQGQWRDGQFTVAADLNAARWPHPLLRRYVGTEAHLEAEGRVADGITIETLRASMDGANVTARRAAEGWDAEALISAERLSNWTGETIAARRIHWAGRVTVDGQMSADGRLEAADVGYRGFGADTLEGPLHVTRTGTGFDIAVDAGTAGMTYPADQLASLLGPHPDLMADISWIADARRLEFTRLVLAGEAAHLEADGGVDVRERSYAFDGILDAPDLSAVAPFDGQARSQVTLRGGFDGSLEIDVEGSAESLAGHAAFERLGDRIALTASASRSAAGQWRVERAQANGEGLIANWTASQDAAGQWSADGEAALEAALDAGPMQLSGGAAAAFDARTDDAGTLVWRLDATSPGLDAGPLSFTTPRLRVEGRGGASAFAADIRVTAGSAYGDIDLSGEIVRGEDWQLNAVTGRAGPAQVTADGAFADSGSEADLSLSGTLPGGGPASLTARLNGGDTLRLDVVARAEAWQAGALELDRVEARMSGPLERLALTVTARGSYGYEWQIAAEGDMRNGPEELAVTLASRGEVGPHALTSTEPFTLRSVDAGQHAAGAWTLGPMTLSMDAVMGADADTVSIRFSDMPAELLSQVRGRSLTEGGLSGALSYQRGTAGLRASAWIEADNIRPAGGDPEQVINARLEAEMPGDVFTAHFEARGAELVSTADIRVETGSIARLGDIRDQAGAPVTGQAQINGPIGTLTRFYLPESQTLRGDLAANARVTGTVGAPDFSGDLRFAGGTFTDIRQGVHVVDITASGSFAGDGATLDSLSATDGGRGTLSASGGISFADARPDGQFDVEFRNFQAVDQRTLSVTATGDAGIEIGPEAIHVTGEARLDEVEARPPESGREPIVEIEVTEINRPDSLNAAPQTRTSPITLDYHVTAPGRIFIRGPAFDSEWSADVQARGPLSALKLLGRADLLRGSASLVGRPFELESGVVRFSGAPDEASVDIVAQRETEGLTAIVNVSGPVTAPRIALTSRPVLPNDEVLSRVLFGRSVSELSTLEAAQLAAALSSAATGGGGFDAFERLRDLTGVDRLSIRTSASGAPIVTGGRYIDEDVYLEIEAGGGSEAGTTARIEWELRPNLRLLSRVTGTADASIALRWRKEYD